MIEVPAVVALVLALSAWLWGVWFGLLLNPAPVAEDEPASTGAERRDTYQRFYVESFLWALREPGVANVTEIANRLARSAVEHIHGPEPEPATIPFPAPEDAA